MSDSRQSVTHDVEIALNRLKLSGKKLTETEIPEDVYTSALKMVLSVKYEERYSNNRLFTLIVKRGETLKIMDIKQAPEVIRKWQNSLKLLLRYPMDLYIAPNRPELKTIKLTTGFYEYHINRPLTNAKEFLTEMGYRPHPRSLSDYVLKDTSRLIPTITDLIVLHQDLTAVSRICETVLNVQMSKTMSGRILTLTHVLTARQQNIDPSVMGCIGHLMHNLSHGVQYLECNNNTSPPQSLISRSSVDCDGQSSMPSDRTPPAIKPRKNLQGAGMHSRSFDTLSSTSSSTFSPPDPSQLPPPVFTESELMLLFESKSRESLRRDSQSREDTMFLPNQTQSPPPRDMDSQIYKPFDRPSYKPVEFSVGGYGHDDLKEEEVWNMPQQQQQQDYPPVNNRNTSFTSFQHRAPIRRSSEGNVLEQSSSMRSMNDKYYSPPTPLRSTQPPPAIHQPVSTYQHGDASYGQHLQSLSSHVTPAVNNAEYGRQQQPVSRAPVVNNSQYGRQQQPVSCAPVVNNTNAGYNDKNLAGPQYSNIEGRSQHTKDVGGYLQRNNHQLYPTGTNTGATSSTWGGESHRQYMKQMSDPRTNSQSSIDAMDLATNDNSYNPRPWKCRRCKIDYGSEAMGCGTCGELAPFIDLDGTPDTERKKEQPPASKQQRREQPPPRNQIATDHSKYSQPPPVSTTRGGPNYPANTRGDYSNYSPQPPHPVAATRGGSNYPANTRGDSNYNPSPSPAATRGGPNYPANTRGDYSNYSPSPHPVATTRGGSNYPANTRGDSNYSPSPPPATTRGADKPEWECMYCLTVNYGDMCTHCRRPK